MFTLLGKMFGFLNKKNSLLGTQLEGGVIIGVTFCLVGPVLGFFIPTIGLVIVTIVSIYYSLFLWNLAFFLGFILTSSAFLYLGYLMSIYGIVWVLGWFFLIILVSEGIVWMSQGRKKMTELR